MLCTAAGFATAQAIQSWIEAQFEVVYTRGSIHTLLARLGIRLKRPRPRSSRQCGLPVLK
ncbi:MAG: winged helix-turn-helix domain-containing protein [Caldilineaceae bacterium SB0662_bin_9]|uniref:Winged helix-turn-helix domain-containing protein n=1 Tax=Caldilineaceae bacterium SB0662_bin_9 TaxID=2605258 RepID=A0A6B1DRY8_9CHLR|nr:winged helix-turn-helix domain-containing protein [Caldilineaceae bacterium SB0666_bin_21]MYD89987.1 winged helix-turn-helix domain-containing protein [Caldilineaceae bacterium SB0662_bin_9]